MTDEYGACGGMRIDRGGKITRRNIATVLICSTTNPI
jgi:hypothetical protein